jgi:hypothetical protein
VQWNEAVVLMTCGILRAAGVITAALRDVTACSEIGLLKFWAKRVEGAASSEMLVLSLQTTRRHMPEALDEVSYCKAEPVGMYCGRYNCNLQCCLQAFLKML